MARADRSDGRDEQRAPAAAQQEEAATTPTPPTTPAPSERRFPRRSLLWLVVAGVAVVALGVAGLVVGVQDRQPASHEPALSRPGNGKLAPAIDLPRLNGDGTVSLAAFRGRPVVVNFFASWCIPCRQEMPAFQAVSTQLKNRVAFMGVNHNDDRGGALKLLADTGVQYPTGYDPQGHVAATYGLFGMPSTLFVGADGKLLETHTGELSRQQLEQTLSRLFGV